MRNLAEVVRQIRVDHLLVAGVQQSMHVIDGIECTSSRPVGVLLRRQVHFEYRRQHQRCRRLRHPVSDARNAQGPKLPALLLRDENLTNRFGPVGPLLQVPRQFPEPPLHAVRLDVGHRLTVHPGRTAVTAHVLPGDGQHIGTPHLVAQRVEAETRRFLRFRM